MAYIHIASTTGFTVDDVRRIEGAVGDRGTIDGLLLETYGETDGGVHIVTVWESESHKDRYEAERLLPAFQAAGVGSEVMANTTFTTCDAASLYRR